MDIRLYGEFELLSPLSHISEAISTHSYLVQEPILQEDGSIEEVFCYSGNAWRGQLRDACAKYMLDKLNIQLPIDSFHLLFSGGKIGGDQVVDIEAAKILRRNVPMISLFGGGVGNQILAGKMRVRNCYPICKETIRLLPQLYSEEALNYTYKEMTHEKSFTRMDDSKNDLNDKYIADEPEEKDPKEKKKGVTEQMRMTSELVNAGVRLHTAIDMLNITEIEIGAIIGGLTEIFKSPHMGGQSNKGHGRFSLKYSADIKGIDFVHILKDKFVMSDFISECRDKYDDHLLSLFPSSFVDPKEEKVMNEFWGIK